MDSFRLSFITVLLALSAAYFKSDRLFLLLMKLACRFILNWCSLNLRNPNSKSLFSWESQENRLLEFGFLLQSTVWNLLSVFVLSEPFG